MMFKTQFNPHPRFHCAGGSRTRVHYQSRFDSRGNLVLMEDGVINDYEAIQSHADSVDIHKILDRFAAGDVDVLSKVQGFYADFADTPSTYQEILNAVIAGEQTFNSLPVEVKDKFGHSFQRWMMSMGTPEFYAAMDVTHDQLVAAAVDKTVPSQPVLAVNPEKQIEVKEDKK